MTAAVDLEFTAYGRTFTLSNPEGVVVRVSDLLEGEPGTALAVLDKRIAAARESARQEWYDHLQHAVAEVDRVARHSAELMALGPEETARWIETLRAHAADKLDGPAARRPERIVSAAEDRARERVETLRTRLLSARHRAGRDWHVGGTRSRRQLIHQIHASVTILGVVHDVTLERRANLPKSMREGMATQPLDVVVSAGEAFVAEFFEPEQDRLERALARLAARIKKVASVPGFDATRIHQAIRNEFGQPDIDIDVAASRVRARIDEEVQRAKEATAVHTLLTRHSFANYAAFFRKARSLRRILTLYVGPTNSGKTWHALNMLAASRTGVYLAPLRLLALEGQEELEKRGVVSSFLTGEERDLRPGAPFTSSTIEMLDFERVVDTAVIDEVQLLKDADRGWAWSAAIIGVPARRVAMTGSPECVDLIRALADYLQEPLEIIELKRFTPLRVNPAPSDIDQVRPGTAVVCFARRDVLAIKQHVEQRHRVSVIYGNLSPQVRREEARRFRAGETSVLVATDAIALGLNLPIRTVLFYTTWKFDGREDVRLDAAHVRQIGGRAGRFGKHEKGFVGAFNQGDLAWVSAAFAEEPAALPARALVRPGLEHVRAMSRVLGSKRLGRILDLFRRRISFDSKMLCAAVPDEMMEVAALVDSFELSLDEKFTFACSPVDTRSSHMMREFEGWLRNFSSGRRSRLPALEPQYGRVPEVADPNVFFNAELRVKILTVYTWLAFRYPEMFPDLEESDRQRQVLNRYIEQTLRMKGRMRRCTQCGVALPALFSFERCDECFRRRRRRR